MEGIITEKYRRLLEDWKRIKSKKVAYANLSAKIDGLEHEQSVVYNLWVECDLIQSRYLGQNLRSDYNNKQLGEVQVTLAEATKRLSELNSEIPELKNKITKEEFATNGTTDPEYAIKLFGAGKVGARIKCSYAELYLADGRKVYSLQKSADINNAKNFLLLVTGYKGKGVVELSLTKLGYDYLCKQIATNKKTDGVYSELWPYLFIDTPDGGYQKSYRPIKLYAYGSALRYFPSDSALAPSLNDEQGTIISNYEVDEHNQQIQDEINKKREELERKKKQVILLGLAAGAVSLFAFN